jgi:hypothetical protein
MAPLKEDLGFTGNTCLGTDILQGCYDTSKLPAPVQLLLQHLKYNMQAEDVPPSSSVITEAAYIAKLKCWNESTSTSPSGLHLGHYKALIARHAHSDLHPDDPLRILWDQMQSELRMVHLSLLNYALFRGYSYERWQQVTNVMLFKEAGNIQIHRTRCHTHLRSRLQPGPWHKLAISIIQVRRCPSP